MAEKSDGQSSQSNQSIRQQVRVTWFRNKLLTAKPMCVLLGLPRSHEDYVAHKISEAKSDYQSSQGLKRLSYHKPHGWIYALKDMSREAAVEAGWVETKARNHYLLWRDPKGFGRLEWHQKGRINIIVKKPLTEARILQLLANAFCWTKLVPDVRVFEEWARTARFKGYSVTIDLGIPLPYFKCDLFRESNGFGLTSGDKSHPTCLELDIFLPDWVERLELLQKENIRVIETDSQAFQRFNDLLKDLSSQPKPLKDQGRGMVV